MFKDKKVSLITPSHNEPEGIRAIITNAPSFIDEIIVVDASDDDTGSIAASLGAKVITEKRRGYGRAYKTGFTHAQGDIIITMDADLTYPIAEEELLPLMETFINENIDFLNTSRFPLDHAPEAMTPIRNIGNKIINLVGNTVFHTQVKDFLSGMWIFKRNILPRFKLYSNDWSFSEEIKLEAIINKVKFKEVHINYRMRLGNASLIDFALNQIKVGLLNSLYFFRKRFFRNLTWGMGKDI